jgi:hypothetical protein
MSWDFLMRLRGFGSLCGFLMWIVCVWLENCLIRFHGFFAVKNEISFWDFMLFVTKFVLYTYLQTHHHGMLVSGQYFWERLAGRDVNSRSSGSRVGSGGQVGGEEVMLFGRDFLMKCHTFLAVMSFLYAISCAFRPLWVSWDFCMYIFYECSCFLTPMRFP